MRKLTSEMAKNLAMEETTELLEFLKTKQPNERQVMEKFRELISE